MRWGMLVLVDGKTGANGLSSPDVGVALEQRADDLLEGKPGPEFGANTFVLHLYGRYCCATNSPAK